MNAEFEDLLPRFAEREARDAETYPAESIDELFETGVISGPFPEEMGGLGWTLRQAVEATEQVAAASPSIALIMVMPVGLAGVYASDASPVPGAHRATWLAQADDVAGRFRRREIFAACNSEKGAGGSLAATKTVAEGSPGEGFRLTGEKILASSGEYATHFFSTAKVTDEQLPGSGVVEFFYVEAKAPGVEVLRDWDGFGMRSTESQSVRYRNAPAWDILGFPNFIETMKPLQYWYCLFAAIPLGCAAALLRGLSNPAPESPALRLRLSEARMRYEALRAYLLETAGEWRAAAPPSYQAKVLRMKTYVTQESTKLAAELFALSGGRHYRRTSPLANALAGSFAGTALRPPLPLGLDILVESFEPMEAEREAVEA